MLEEDTKWLDATLDKIFHKIGANIDKIANVYPHVAIDGKFNDQGASFWTSGFWGGLLWLYYRSTGNERARILAIELEDNMDDVLDGFLSIHHDVGFMWIPTSMAHYLDDGNGESLLRLLKASSHLAGRFNLKGGFIRAWTDEVMEGSQGWAIIDCLMNLSLLYWASKHTSDPRFRHIAVAHTDTILEKARRADGSYPHIVSFNPENGEKIENLGGQGYSAESAWSRGQAWAIYGLSIGYRETGDTRYQDAAKQISDFFISHLTREGLSPWDFRADSDSIDILDTSASAIAASGMLELSAGLPQSCDKYFYEEKALEILKALDMVADYSEDSEGVIQHGTVDYPASEFVDVPIIYGDYFYLEALLKLKGEKGLF